jgi:hypothetical protein
MEFDPGSKLDQINLLSTRYTSLRPEIYYIWLHNRRTSFVPDWGSWSYWGLYGGTMWGRLLSFAGPRNPFPFPPHISSVSMHHTIIPRPHNQNIAVNVVASLGPGWSVLRGEWGRGMGWRLLTISFHHSNPLLCYSSAVVVSYWQDRLF